MTLSPPSHVVPIDECHVVCTGSDCPRYPHCPAHLLGICDAQLRDPQVRNQFMACLQ